MATVTPLARFTVPIGGQDIELAEVVHDAGGLPLLRVRIREQRRFTVFDLDPVTARTWAGVLLDWAEATPGSAPAAALSRALPGAPATVSRTAEPAAPEPAAAIGR